MAERRIFFAQTGVQQIEFTRLPDGEVALYLDGEIQFVSGWDEAIYHHTLATVPAKMLADRPVHALILGGGDGLAARNLAEFANILSITLVEIDPEMIEFSSTNPCMKDLNKNVFSDERLKVVIDDARHFGSSSTEKYCNLVIFDLPDPHQARVQEVYTDSFYIDVVDHVASDSAVFSAQASAAFSWVEERVYQGLSTATRTQPGIFRFSGEWMSGGSVVMAGEGLAPALLENFNPDDLRLEEGETGTRRRIVPRVRSRA